MATLQQQREHREVIGVPTTLGHEQFGRMMTEIGMWQHCRASEPDHCFGYSIDDQARAVIVGVGYSARGIDAAFWEKVVDTCFRFIKKAAIRSGDSTGRFHNFCDENGAWLDSVGSDDSFGRTLWSVCLAMVGATDHSLRSQAEAILKQSLPVAAHLGPIRSQAFTIIGLAQCRPDDPLMPALADRMVESYRRCASKEWPWFEEGMTYCNARLPQALFLAGQAHPERTEYTEIAHESLQFLLKTMSDRKGGYAPIGNAPLQTRHWFTRDDARPPQFDQQPVDAGALVEACATAHRITKEPSYQAAALGAYRWYFGQNIHGLSLYDPETGGVVDGLHPDGASANMGAESVISIHLANLALMDL